MESLCKLRVWRICNAKYTETAFDGQGAKKYGARWNPIGTEVVYTSSSLALAALELLVHLGAKASPVSYVAIPVDIPENLLIDRVNKNNLPSNWRDDPPPFTLTNVGKQWVNGGGSAVIQVPSAVIEEECNYLFNPNHRDFAQLIIGAARTFQFDLRLFKK
jgi:RES domain-containing protein